VERLRREGQYGGRETKNLVNREREEITKSEQLCEQCSDDNNWDVAK
jgi:hypothetical protein